MGERNYLGELELMILLAVISLGDGAYGVPISREIEKNLDRDVSFGSVYAALERLAARGLVTYRVGDPTPERGGKARRYFCVTEAGLQQIQEMRRILQQMWRKLPDLKKEPV